MATTRELSTNAHALCAAVEMLIAERPEARQVNAWASCFVVINWLPIVFPIVLSLILSFDTVLSETENKSEGREFESQRGQIIVAMQS